MKTKSQIQNTADLNERFAKQLLEILDTFQKEVPIRHQLIETLEQAFNTILDPMKSCFCNMFLAHTIQIEKIVNLITTYLGLNNIQYQPKKEEAETLSCQKETISKKKVLN